ncbi:MAG: trypsin-like peptidase domain-containing protein, partial [Bacteroidota bacterium]|nr:trypsin-like peptidase domain-containing protein [Bacteroidota bacterium]
MKHFPNTLLKLFVLLLTAASSLTACDTASEGGNTATEGGEAVPHSAMQARGGDGDEISNSRRNAITRAIEVVSPAVVGINVTELRERRIDPWFRFFYGEQYYRTQSAGSGFIISEDGYIITNDHVVGRAEEMSVTMTDGSKHPAVLIGTDPVTDLALIRVEVDHPLPHLEFGDSDDVIVGEWSIAFGNPFGLFSASAKPTVTVGVISATHVYLEQREGRVYRNMLQTDAAINQGNSGGPLVNSEGRVIGINTVIYTPNQGSIGLGFAVPVNRAREIIAILRDEGKVDRDFNPGFRVQLVNDAIAQAYDLDRAEGVIVTQLTARDGVARQSGLEVADIILEADGEPVFSINVLESLIRYSIRGERIRLKILRN